MNITLPCTQFSIYNTNEYLKEIIWLEKLKTLKEQKFSVGTILYFYFSIRYFENTTHELLTQLHIRVLLYSIRVLINEMNKDLKKRNYKKRRVEDSNTEPSAYYFCQLPRPPRPSVNRADAWVLYTVGLKVSERFSREWLAVCLRHCNTVG